MGRYSGRTFSSTKLWFPVGSGFRIRVPNAELNGRLLSLEQGPRKEEEETEDPVVSPELARKGWCGLDERKPPLRLEEGAPEFSASGIRKLRKKLGVSQKKLASLVGVSPASVVAWEGGKYKPRDGKAGELSNLAKWDKAEVRNSLANKESKPAEEKSAEGSPVEKTQIKGKRRTRRKAVQKASEEK